jgi:hypothetical protein
MTTTPETDTRIDEIRAREQAATPGHWGTYYDGEGTYTVQAQPRLIPGTGNVSSGDIATLSGEHGDGKTYANARFIAHARADVAYLLDRVAEPAPDIPGIEHDAIHKHFGLSYANYLVIPRTLLQSMPDAWQTQFVALLKALEDAFAHVPQADVYDVTAGKEDLLRDMTESELFQAGVEVTGDDELGHGPDTVYRSIKTGEELEGDSYGFRPGKDPVPHYNRGRARVEPRVGGGE